MPRAAFAFGSVSFFPVVLHWTREVSDCFTLRFVTQLRFSFSSFKMTETMQLRGTLRGHNGWVTQIATNPIHTDMILSCSRGMYGYGTLRVTFVRRSLKETHRATYCSPIWLSPFVAFCRQDSDRMGSYSRWAQLRHSQETFVWTLSLRQRRRSLVGRQLRSFRILGQDFAFVGFGCRTYHSSLRRPHQGSIYLKLFFYIFFFFIITRSFITWWV